MVKKLFALFFKIIILIICWIKFLFRGKADRKLNNLGKFLIFQRAKLGDMVCTTPMFRAVKIKYPNSKLFVMGSKVNRELLAGNPDIDEYRVYKNNFFEIIKNIKKEKIDFACVASPNSVGLAMFYLAGIPLICAPVIKNGWSPYQTWTYKLLCKLVVTKSHYMGHYASREYLKLLEPIGIFTEDTKKHLFLSEGAKNKINKFFEENNINPDADFIIGISPSAGNKIKLWAGDKFAKLADYIYQKYKAKIIITAGSNEKRETEEMLRFLDENTKVINTTGLFNIDELKALISKLSLFISVDTGPIYLAEAFAIPTIDIIGPMDEREQPPIGPLHRIIKVPDRIPALHIMNARVYDEKEARRQIEEITVEMVIKEFNDLMDELKKYAIKNDSFK